MGRVAYAHKYPFKSAIKRTMVKDIRKAQTKYLALVEGTDGFFTEAEPYRLYLGWSRI